MTLTTADLERGKDNLDALDRQINEKTLTTANSDGQPVQTITGALTNFGYEPPVLFAAGADVWLCCVVVIFSEDEFKFLNLGM